MRGNSLTIRCASAFRKVLARSGPYFLRMKSGLRLMGGPPPSRFFFAATRAEPEELIEVISHVAIAPALVQDLEVGADKGRSTAEEKGDLANFHFFGGELGTTCERGQVIGNRLWRVVHDLADLRGCPALEREADDLSAVGEDWAQVVVGAAHRDQDPGVCRAHYLQVARDRSWSDKGDPIGEVFGGEQGSLTERLLAEVEESSLTKSGRPKLLENEVVDLSPMQCEADGLLGADGDGLASRLFSGNGD